MAEHPHPFPAHIVQAVAKAIYASEFRHPEIGAYSWEENLTGEERTDYMSGAQYVLTALWDASRVDLEQDYDTVPAWSHILANDGYVIWKSQDGHFAQGGPAAANYLSPHAHILYWGDHDR